MEKQKLFDISAARKPEETKILLNERLLPQEEGGDKDILDDSLLIKNTEINACRESSPKTPSRLIKPVSKMTVMNDNVRRVTLPDGRPAPQPQNPIQIDIVLWFPVLYFSWALGSFILALFILLVLDAQS